VPLAALFELDEPQDPFEWESNVAVSLDMNKGNTDTANGQIRADTMVRFDDHRHFGEVTLSREEVTDPTTNIRSTTKEQDIFRYNYNFLFNDPWFFASSFTFERDPIAELDSRVIISAGVGRDVWNTPRRSLSVQLGAGFQQEELSSNTTDSTVATWTLRYRQDLFGDDVGVFHNQSITHNITGRTNTSYRTSTGLSYEITDLLTSNISLDFDYQTDPARLPNGSGRSGGERRPHAFVRACPGILKRQYCGRTILFLWILACSGCGRAPLYNIVR
jgi:putative salt-induced outer membrane protein YdiY